MTTSLSEKTRVLKLGVIGPLSVGKSALTIRYIQKVFIDEYLPSFENLFKKSLVIKNKPVEIDILDSSGMDEVVVMRSNSLSITIGLKKEKGL